MQRDGKNSPIESWVLKYIIPHGLSVKSMHGNWWRKLNIMWNVIKRLIK